MTRCDSRCVEFLGKTEASQSELDSSLTRSFVSFISFMVNVKVSECVAIPVHRLQLTSQRVAHPDQLLEGWCDSKEKSNRTHFYRKHRLHFVS